MWNQKKLLKSVLNENCKRSFTVLCWLGSGVLLFVLAIHFLSPWQWLLVRGESVTGHVALMEKMPVQLKQGDYALLHWQGVDPNRQNRLHTGMKLVKQLACVPGQHLLVTAAVAFCDEVFLGAIRRTNQQGKPLLPALYDGIIPSGRYFVMGDALASYDSRYLGLIPESWILGRLLFKV